MDRKESKENGGSRKVLTEIITLLKMKMVIAIGYSEAVIMGKIINRNGSFMDFLHRRKTGSWKDRKSERKEIEVI